MMLIERIVGSPVAHIIGQDSGDSSVGDISLPTAMTFMLAMISTLALVAGGIMTSYVLVVGSVRTAQQGRFLGKWDSVMLPFRVGGSFLMVIPMPGLGWFSGIQAFVLLCAALGIGAASAAATAIFPYIVDHGVLTGSMGESGDKLIKDLVTQAACDQHQVKKRGASGSVVISERIYKKNAFGQEVEVADLDGATLSHEIHVPGMNCGSVVSQFLFPSRDDLVQPTDTAKFGDMNNAIKSYASKYSASIADLYGQLISLGLPGSNGVLYGWAGATSSQREAMLSDARGLMYQYRQQFEGNIRSAKKSVAQLTVSAYIGGSSTSPSAQKMSGALGSLRDYGWMYLGAYYVVLGQVQDKVGAFDTVVADINHPSFKAIEGAEEVIYENRMAPMVYAASIVNPASTLAEARKQIENAGDKAEGGYLVKALRLIGDVYFASVTAATNFVTEGGQEYSGLSTYYSSINSGSSPVMLARKVGTYASNALAGAFVMSKVPIFSRIFGGSGFGGNDKGMPVVSALVMLCLFVAIFCAVVLGVVVPAMPFVIWLIAVLMHLLYVVQALISSPFWAVAHSTPDGHDVVGKGSAGYPIVMTLILRPVLMVGGLVAGMALLHVGGWVINQFFLEGYFLSRVGVANVFSPLVMFALLAAVYFLMTYRFMMLTHELPVAVLEMLGSRDSSNYGEQKAMEKIEQSGGQVTRVLGR